MIGPHIESFLLSSGDSLMIKAEQVASVRAENNLLHALLVLSSVGFSSIPVLDNQSNIAGKLTMAMIVNGVLSGEDYDWSLLTEKKVRDVMDVRVPRVENEFDLETILHTLVDTNYLCVTDADGFFRGIITRKAILKRINALAHKFEQCYDVTEAAPASEQTPRHRHRKSKGNRLKTSAPPDGKTSQRMAR